MTEIAPVASIEIFRDSVCKDIDIGEVEQGIEQVNSITGGLAIVRKTRLIRLAADTAESIDPEKIRWLNLQTDLQADLNIVATHRPFAKYSEYDPEGNEVLVDSFGVTDYYSRVAITDVRSPSRPQTVVAHELAHLLGIIKSRGIEHIEAGGGHCPEPGCVMSRGLRRPKSRHIQQTGFKKVLESTRFREPEYFIPEIKPLDFCELCTEALKRQAFFRKRRKAGLYTPDNWV